MGSSSLMQEFKRQASFFLREKIKTARLVLTDVTPAQLLTEEVTNGESMAVDSYAMRLISRAAFEVDDYERIVHILHHRLSKFETWNWRASYRALVLLEHLLTHGPQRIADEFESDEDTIAHMATFHYVDNKGLVALVPISTFNSSFHLNIACYAHTHMHTKLPNLKRRERERGKLWSGSKGLVASTTTRAPPERKLINARSSDQNLSS